MAVCGEAGDKSARNVPSLIDIFKKAHKETPFYMQRYHFYNGVVKGIIGDAKFIEQSQKNSPLSIEYYKKLADYVYKIYNFKESYANNKRKSKEFIKYIQTLDTRVSYENFLIELNENPEKVYEYQGRIAYEIVKDVLIAKGLDKLAKAGKAGKYASKYDDVAKGTSSVGKYGDDFGKYDIKRIPKDPNDFNPKGLMRQDYKDGEIIKWHEINSDGSRGKAIFEWNLDIKYGDHFHITPDGKNRIVSPLTNDTHLYPNDLIPREYLHFFK